MHRCNAKNPRALSEPGFDQGGCTGVMRVATGKCIVRRTLRVATERPSMRHGSESGLVSSLSPLKPLELHKSSFDRLDLRLPCSRRNLAALVQARKLMPTA